ncbi:MAG: group II truncated hemoglobin [Proteobacteria bacterium]|nr:group II truncated hemoglobin [Pseudomonadota bacterium]
MLSEKENAASEAQRAAKSKRLAYELVGGEDGIRRLVKEFYDIVEKEPEGRVLHILHLRGHGIPHARIEQFNFLSGFLGGPRLYVERYGHSDVRQMHKHVEIDPAARDAWLKCMSMAIDRAGIDVDVKHQLMTNFTRVAMMLKNKD